MDTVSQEEITRFQVGQKVQVKVPIEVLRNIQEGHGGFTPKMMESMPLQGEVMEVTEKGDLRVKYPNNGFWTLNPEAVMLIDEQSQDMSRCTEHDNDGEPLGYFSNLLYVAASLIQAPEEGVRECYVCSEREEMCKLKPCGHKITCIDCTSRLKKCCSCHELITRRIAADGSIIDFVPKDDRPTLEKVRYLEMKVRTLEDNATCNICLENLRDRVFRCGHSCCQTCAMNMNNCHICRQPVRDTIPLFNN